jgi:hypothetical protein
MTEDEAKTKWCPFSRTTEATGESCSFPRNRVARPFDEKPPMVFSDTLIGCNCIASGCMAWRWMEEPQWETALTRSSSAGSPAPPPGEGWEEARRWDGEVIDGNTGERMRRYVTYWRRPIIDAKHGHCGWAGKP